MKNLFLGVTVQFLFAFTANGQGLPDKCDAYWEARKAGTDWSYREPLSTYDSRCSSNVVVAKDQNKCGVLIGKDRSSIIHGIPPMTADGRMNYRYSSNIAISWFDCDVNGNDYSFGDYVPGEVTVFCWKTCQGCATGPRDNCSINFMPKAYL